MTKKKTARPCSFTGCRRTAVGRGLCNKHYLATWRKAALPTKEANDRFLDRPTAITTTQDVNITRLLAFRIRQGNPTTRAALFREMIDAFFAALSDVEKEAVSKPLPMSFD